MSVITSTLTREVKESMNPKHGGRIHHLIRTHRFRGAEITDFSASINFLGPPDAVSDVLKKAAFLASHYPDPEAISFRNTCGEYLGLPPEFILAGNGSAEFIYSAVLALRPQRALIPVPTFAEYEAAVLNSGGEVSRFELSPDDSFRLPTETLEGLLEGRGGELDLLFLCNPNNPTGTLAPREGLRELVRIASRHSIPVVLDEAFMDFLPDQGDFSLVSDLTHFENLLILRSLTKFFAIPGLRSGVALAQPQLLRRLEGVRPPWSMNALAQEASRLALEDDRFIRRSRRVIAAERRHLNRGLEELGAETYPSPANFILFSLEGTGTSASELQRDLIRHRVLIRDCSSFPGLSDHHVRVAVRSRRDNNRLLRLLRPFFRSG